MRKKFLTLLLAACFLFSLLPVTAFAEQTKWTQTDSVSTSKDYASLMNGEYYEAKTPSGEKNALYVKGKAQQGVKTLRIALYNIAKKSNYINVFVQPASNGSFEVKINTAAGNKTVPEAINGKVFSGADKAWDSRPGYKAVSEMPTGMYLLRITSAKTTADADVCNGAAWSKGTLGGEHGFVWDTAMLYVSGSDNDPKLIEFTDIVNRAKKTQSAADADNPRYTDVYLKDMSYLLKDANFNSKPMTADRVAYIKKVAESIASGASNDAAKLAKIYSYVTTNFYYDHYAYDLYIRTGGKSNIQCVNPYDNLYNHRNKIASTNSTADGKVATVCDGYASMIVALCRSLGIPARSVYGCRNDTSDGLTSQVNTANKNHWWAEVYINGRWVTVDAERGSLNSWNRDELGLSSIDSRYRDEKYKASDYWDYQGSSVSGLDMSYAARATNFLLTGVQDSTGGKPYVDGISASVDSISGKPMLTWTSMSAAEKYYIYRGTRESAIEYYASSKTSTYIDISAVVDKTYYYWVTPVISGEEGSKSNMVSVKCTAASDTSAAPTAPTLKITTSAGKPQIYWNPVSGSVKYWIYRSTDGKKFSYYDKTTNTSYTNNSTEIGTTYYYKVKAVNANGASSDPSSVVSILCKPAAPTVSINRSNGKPKLSWKAVSGATKYWIYRSTDGKKFKYFDSTTKTSYTNSGAASGTKYYYRVKAVTVVNGKNVASAYSNTKSLLTSLAKPSVSITTSNGKPKLTWKAVTGADKYYVYRSTDGKNFSYWDSTTKTSYVNSGAKKNTKYYYKVKAVCASNSNANSAQSTAVSIKATK
ncbi:MAG: transglutaminase domain-containing protein [Oscillospiraceae bacterium]|nr:transglutaminase domain-containing protein [Oscillospiraceae bacterium]